MPPLDPRDPAQWSNWARQWQDAQRTWTDWWQKSLPPPELAARQAACADEGAKLFAEGNALQQGILKRLAKRRMDKLLGA